MKKITKINLINYLTQKNFFCKLKQQVCNGQDHMEYPWVNYYYLQQVPMHFNFNINFDPTHVNISSMYIRKPTNIDVPYPRYATCEIIKLVSIKNLFCPPPIRINAD